MQHPSCLKVLDTYRFSSVAQQLYGEDVIGIGTDANRYVGDTGWHPDHGPDPAQDCYGVKFAFYLDPVDGFSGALRLIPGSHVRPFHEQLRGSLQSMGLDVAQIPAHVCNSNPGDVVAFDMRCWHASHGGAQGRRMCTCVYYSNPAGEAAEAATRKRAASSRDTATAFGRPGQPVYPTEWLQNPLGSSQRQRWLQRMEQLGYFELPA